MAALQSLRYERGTLEVLDQLKVPQSKEYIAVPDCEAAWDVVRKMQVRGAPLIAMVSALGLAVEVTRREEALQGSAQEAADWLTGRTAYLRTSRPTAVNLFNAMRELDEAIRAASSAPGATAASVGAAYVAKAEAMLEEDVRANKAIGEAGARAILAGMGAKRATEGARVITICNTGSLATAGWGTALGIVRSLHGCGRLEHVYALETRPYNQGSRLTAFEIVEEKMAGTLVCDSMAAALMRKHRIDACVVGADRVAANGDTANKIGTYALAVLAKHHGVPFYVAAPTTTLDPRTPSGAEIEIEERPAEELTSIKIDGQVHSLAAPGIGAWNPAFDVATAELITGIVTERGLIPKSLKKGFAVTAFLQGKEGPSAAGKRGTGGAAARKPAAVRKTLAKKPAGKKK